MISRKDLHPVALVFGSISLLVSIFTSSLAYGADGADSPNVPIARVSGACTSSENWTLEEGFPRDFRRDFEKFSGGRSGIIQGFSDAIALRRLAALPQTKALSEYWISRSLYEAKLPHIAVSGLSMVAAREPSPQTLSPQLAALACLIKIHQEHPGIAVNLDVLAQLEAFSSLVKSNGDRKSDREIVFEAAALRLQQELGATSVDAQDIEKTLALLKGAGIHETFAKGLWAARRSAHSTTIAELSKFLDEHESQTGSRLPKQYQKYVDTAHLLVARALYSTKKYDKSVAHLRKVSRSSNELAESLSELSWNYLMDARYTDAVGTATSLQAGGMRNTFAPEGTMVMAMALNEICQYPDSTRAIAIFRKIYEKPYRWLSAHVHGRIDVPSGQYYKMALAHLRKQGDTPIRIASEWVRTPLFISTQDEINTLFQEKQSTGSLGSLGQSEQEKVGRKLLALAQELKPELKTARKRVGATGQLPARLVARLGDLRGLIISYNRMMNAAPVWRSILNTHQGRAAKQEKILVARIDDDIRKRNTRMSNQLEELAENIQLIEVEIYNGATHDIIWQNAHPDYKELAKQLQNREETEGGKVWDWGRQTASLDDDDAEIWEDELGSFRADTLDNCSNRDKFLALKRLRAAGH